jgi:histidyl-tRNA synthetase
MGVTGDQFTSTCVVIDKFDKLPKSECYEELTKLGIAAPQIERLFTFLAAKDLDSIAEMVRREDKGVQELVELLGMCKSYGFGDWIEFDPKIVRYWGTGGIMDREEGSGTI